MTTRSIKPALSLPVPPPQHLWFRGSWPIAVDKACKITGRSACTLARQAAAGWPDVAVLTCLQAVVFGVLPHPDWKEWAVSPDGHLAYWRPTRGIAGVLPSDLMRGDAMAKELSSQRGIIRALRAEISALKAATATPEQLPLVLRLA